MNFSVKNNLAIVIPAYKIEFLESTLDSIANQTCKEFTLYIGDDASPFDLLSIITKYENRIKIVYKRFDENFGGSDLVKQWERCINLTNTEEWIWLFSDDDIMEPTCVESFYEISGKLYDNLYHFNIKVIDKDNQLTGQFYNFPEKLSSKEFIERRLSHKLLSFVVEYIFTKKWFLENEGFQKFDLAWGSDDATWIKLSRSQGIQTIGKCNVLWRQSGVNISTVRDKATVTRKINSKLHFINWLQNFCNENNLNFSKIQFLLGYLHGIKSKLDLFNRKEINQFVKLYFTDKKNSFLIFFAYQYLISSFIYSKIKGIFNIKSNL